MLPKQQYQPAIKSQVQTENEDILIDTEENHKDLNTSENNFPSLDEYADIHKNLHMEDTHIKINYFHSDSTLFLT